MKTAENAAAGEICENSISGKCLTNSAAAYTCCEKAGAAYSGGGWQTGGGGAACTNDTGGRRRRLVTADDGCDDVTEAPTPVPAPEEPRCKLFCTLSNTGCCMFNAKIAVSADTVVGEIPIKLTASYETSKAAVAIAGRCGSTAGVCVDTLFGIGGLGIAELGVSASWSGSGPLTALAFDGAVRIGSSAHMFAGEFFRQGDKLTGIEFQLPQIGGMAFGDRKSVV